MKKAVPRRTFEPDWTVPDCFRPDTIRKCWGAQRLKPAQEQKTSAMDPWAELARQWSHSVQAPDEKRVLEFLTLVACGCTLAAREFRMAEVLQERPSMEWYGYHALELSRSYSQNVEIQLLADVIRFQMGSYAVWRPVPTSPTLWPDHLDPHPDHGPIDCPYATHYNQHKVCSACLSRSVGGDAGAFARARMAHLTFLARLGSRLLAGFRALGVETPHLSRDGWGDSTWWWDLLALSTDKREQQFARVESLRKARAKTLLSRRAGGVDTTAWFPTGQWRRVARKSSAEPDRVRSQAIDPLLAAAQTLARPSSTLQTGATPTTVAKKTLLTLDGLAMLQWETWMEIRLALFTEMEREADTRQKRSERRSAMVHATQALAELLLGGFLSREEHILTSEDRTFACRCTPCLDHPIAQVGLSRLLSDWDTLVPHWVELLQQYTSTLQKGHEPSSEEELVQTLVLTKARLPTFLVEQ